MPLLRARRDEQIQIALEPLPWRISPYERSLQDLRFRRHSDRLRRLFAYIERPVFVEEDDCLSGCVWPHHGLHVHATKAFVVVGNRSRLRRYILAGEIVRAVDDERLEQGGTWSLHIMGRPQKSTHIGDTARHQRRSHASAAIEHVERIGGDPPSLRLRRPRPCREDICAWGHHVGLDSSIVNRPAAAEGNDPFRVVGYFVILDRIGGEIRRPSLAIRHGLVRAIVFAGTHGQAILRRAGRRYRIRIDLPVRVAVHTLIAGCETNQNISVVMYELINLLRLLVNAYMTTEIFCFVSQPAMRVWTATRNKSEYLGGHV